MKALLKKFETAMMAAAFAEEGEFETARHLMSEEKARETSRPVQRKETRPSNRKELRAD